MPIPPFLGRLLFALFLAAVALHRGAPTADASIALAPHRPGELLVRFRDGQGTAARSRAHAARGAVTVKRYPAAANLERVRLAAGADLAEAVAAYERDPAVLWAEPDWQIEATDLPTDQLFSRQWALHNVGQDIGVSVGVPIVPGADIRAAEAWEITTGDPEVVVAVIDSGTSLSHPDLIANLFRNEADCDTDTFDDDGNGYADDCHGIDTANDDSVPLDDNRHGTHVAGIIGAVPGNGIGISGVAWDVRILTCKFLDGFGRGFISDAVECLDYVAAMRARGVRIVATNNSWGSRRYSNALAEAIERQRQHGILFVASAGNAGADVDAFFFGPAGYRVPNVVSVAASEPNDTLTGFSNYGRHTVHLSAPGRAILSTVVSGWDDLSGTSMAAPHVTGVAALLAAQEPTRDWRAIRNLLLSGAAPIAESDKRTITGARLDAFGSLTCSDQVVRRRIAPTTDFILVAPGSPLGLAVLHVTCADPAGELTVTVSPGGASLSLLDDGNGYDQVAGDGTYSAVWTPPEEGTWLLQFPDDSVEVIAGPGVVGPPSLMDGSQFGWSVAAMGDDFVVGAPGDSTGGASAGAIHVVDGASGMVVATYPNPEPLGGDAFGQSLAVQGDRILVGAPSAARGAPGSGSVFLLDGLTGALLWRVDDPEPGANDGFGTAVTFVGDLIAVGEAFANVVGTDSGIVHLFDADGGLVRSLPPASGAPQPFVYGYDLAARGTTLFVSNNSLDVWAAAIQADPLAPDFGSELVRFYGLPVLAAGAGRTVAAAGPWLAAGEPFAILGPIDDQIGAGAVSVADAETGLPHPILPLVRPPDQVEFDNFGQSLAADGERIYVGAPYAPVAGTDGPPIAQGAVFVFDLAAGGFVERYEQPVPSFDSSFGWSIALGGGQVLIGAPNHRDHGPAAGAAFLFPASTAPVDLAPQLYGCWTAAKDRPPRLPLLEHPTATGTARLRLVKHDHLCWPARELGLAVPDFAMGLACYATSVKPAKRELMLRTPIADERLKLTGKTVACMPARLETQTVLPRRAWKCQKARRRGPSDAPRKLELQIERPVQPPYYIDILRVVLSKPTSACTEVDLDSATPLPLERRLVCYRAKTQSSSGYGTQFVSTIYEEHDPFRLRGLVTVCMQATELAP